MKLSVDKHQFLTGLQLAQAVADRKGTLPMTANIRLDATDDQLVCSATNYVVAVKTTIPAECSENGSICLSAKTLFDVVKSLPEVDSAVLVSTNEAHHAVIEAERARFQIMGLPADDFPNLPETQKDDFSEVHPDALLSLVRKVFFSILTEETRPHLNSALWESHDDILRMVSTDGHRLSRADAHLEDSVDLFSEGILVPRRGLTEIRRLLEGTSGTVKVAVEKPYLFLKTESVLMAVRLIDEKFPPYEDVIPSDLVRRVVAERGALLDAIRRVSLLSAGATHGIRFRLTKGLMEVLSRNPDLGEAHEELEVDYDGDEFMAAFNAQYFQDFLPEIDSEELVLEFGEELDPCLIRPVDSDDYVGVIMPLRF
ncbi:MAG: DNA polymerase III subunit beta [Deltaproteobacteria bacterium]|nr:DNA polymerase III subunit beta [Deltaproteobacteria bacterium]